MKFRKLFTYHFLFGLAVILVSAGAGLLVFTTKGVAAHSIFRILLVFAISVIFCYIALIRKAKAKIVFIFLFLAAIAALRFLGQLMNLAPSRYWPLYTILAGLCMLSSNLLLRRKINTSIKIISSAFVFLGGFFSIFSFGYSQMRLRVFLVQWWPVFVIASGVVLLVLWAIKMLVYKKLGLDYADKMKNE
ncbi:hypothetical protein MASR2M29_10180 [Spirochaetota bacterium]